MQTAGIKMIIICTHVIQNFSVPFETVALHRAMEKEWLESSKEVLIVDPSRQMPTLSFVPDRDKTGRYKDAIRANSWGCRSGRRRGWALGRGEEVRGKLIKTSALYSTNCSCKIPYSIHRIYYTF